MQCKSTERHDAKQQEGLGQCRKTTAVNKERYVEGYRIMSLQGLGPKYLDRSS